MPELFQYSPDEVVCVLGGVPISGYAEGTFLEIERTNQSFTIKEGSLGDVVRTKVLSRVAKLTLTLLEQSDSNDVLTSMVVLDELTGNATFTCQIKDLNGSMFVHSEEAWIEKIPKITRGKESGTTQWVILLAFAEVKPGGNVR